MPSVTSNICFMCLSERTNNNKFQLKLVQDEMLKKAAFVLPELPISRQMCPQYACNICYKRILYFYKFKKMCNRNYTRWMYYMTKLGEKTNLKQMQEMKIIVYKSGPPPEESENNETSSSEEDSDVEMTQLRNKLNPQNLELNKNTTQESSIVNIADSSSTNVQSIIVQDKNDAHPNNIETTNAVKNPEIPEKPAIQILNCTICNKKFYTKMTLQYHLNLMHNKENIAENPINIENSPETQIKPEQPESPNKLISLLKMSTEENTQRKALDIVKICEKIKKEIITSKIEDQENSLATIDIENNTTDFKIENVRSLQNTNTRNDELNTSSDEDWTPDQWIPPIQSGSKRSILRPTTSKNYQEKDDKEEAKPVLKRRGRPRKNLKIKLSKEKLINNILDNYMKTGIRPDPEYLSEEDTTEKINNVQNENKKSEILPQPVELHSDECSTKTNTKIKRRPGRPKIIKLSSNIEDIIDNKLTKNGEQSSTDKNTNQGEKKKNIRVHSVQTFPSPDKNALNDIQNKFEKSPDVPIPSTSSLKSEETAVKVTENIEKLQTKQKLLTKKSVTDIAMDVEVTTTTPTNKTAAEDDKDKNKRLSMSKLSIDDVTNTSTNKMAEEIDEKNKKRLKNKRKLISTSEDSDDSVESLTITSVGSISNKNGDRDLETINKMADTGDKTEKNESNYESDILKNKERAQLDLQSVTNVSNVQKKARPKSKQKISSNTENIKTEKLNIQSKARPKSKQKTVETNVNQSSSKQKIIKTRTCEICEETFSGKLILENHLKTKHQLDIPISDSEQEMMSSDDEKKSSNILDDTNDLKKEKLYKPRPKSKRKPIKNDDDKIVTPDDDNKDDTQNDDDDNSADELLNNIQELIDETETSNKSENIGKLRDRKPLMRRKDDIPKGYQCNVCEKKFPYASSLSVHLKRVHLKLRKPCPICQKVLTDTYSILLHIEKCHNTVEVNFAISEQSGDDTNDDSGDDFDGEPPEYLEKNPHVEKMLKMKLELVKQKKMLMIEARKKVDDFLCKICNKTCLNKVVLVSHIKSHKIILKV